MTHRGDQPEGAQLMVMTQSPRWLRQLPVMASPEADFRLVTTMAAEHLLGIVPHGVNPNRLDWVATCHRLRHFRTPHLDAPVIELARFMHRRQLQAERAPRKAASVGPGS